MWTGTGDFSVLMEQNLAKYYFFVMQWDSSYSLSLSYLAQGKSFVKIHYYAPFRGGNCCWGTVSTSPVMYILYCSLKQETQSYSIWLRSSNLLKYTARRSSWNRFENKNGSRHNVLPLGFPLIVWLHMFNMINLVLFHNITFTASGSRTAFAYSILSSY